MGLHQCKEGCKKWECTEYCKTISNKMNDGVMDTSCFCYDCLLSNNYNDKKEAFRFRNSNREYCFESYYYMIEKCYPHLIPVLIADEL